MPESSLESVVKRIEAAIELGDFDEARELIEVAETRLGHQQDLAELRDRLAVVESTLSRSGQVEAAIRRAREETSRANYHAALTVLEGALKEDPGNSELRELLQQTTRAALRHEAAVDRNRAVAQAAVEIGAWIDRGDLEKATSELAEANLRFGKHDTLQALQERLDAAWREAELERTVAYVDQTRAFLDSGKWHDALRQSERILRMDPRNPEAIDMKRRARAEIERDQADRQALHEIDLAREDVERLIAADELVSASRALGEAVDRLGRHDVFEDLAGRLDQAKAELQARKRLEWTQRRLKEADDLVHQASRLNLQGRYEQAIERLEKARELHPDHAEIEDLLHAAETAYRRQQAERRRADAAQSAISEIRQLLDALRLDEAAKRLEAAMARVGRDNAQLQALGTRLRRLREADSEALPPPEAQPLVHGTVSEALTRQHELASAYTWKQTLLFAFRGDGIKVLSVYTVLAVGLEALAAWQPVGPVFLALRCLVPLGALGWLLAIVRLTAQGKNRLSSWGEILDVRRRGIDDALALAIVAVACLPAAVLVATRSWHGLLAGTAGWGLMSVAGWGGAAFGVLAGAAAGVFGPRFVLRGARHAGALAAGAPETVLAADVVFATAVALVVLRVTVLPLVPWIGLPVVAALEAYALLAIPHMIGVVIRRRRIELARVYQ